MNITNVSIRTVNSDSPVRAYASVTIDGKFVFHGVNIVKYKDSDDLFVTMATREVSKGKFMEVFYHPSTRAAREQLSETVINCYRKVIENPEITSFDMGNPTADLRVGSIRFSSYDGVPPVSSSLLLDDDMLINMCTIQLDPRTRRYQISLPKREMKDGSLKDVYHPLNRDTRNAIANAVLAEFLNLTVRQDPA